MKEHLKNPIVISIITGIIASVISLIENKINSKEEFILDYYRYVKIFILVSALSYGILILSPNVLNNNQQGGGSNLSNISNVNGLDIEEIHTGNPNF